MEECSSRYSQIDLGHILTARGLYRNKNTRALIKMKIDDTTRGASGESFAAIYPDNKGGMVWPKACKLALIPSISP